VAFFRHPASAETVSAADMARHLRRMASQRSRWIEGFTFTGSSSPITLQDGFAFIDGRLIGKGNVDTENVNLTADATNHIFLLHTGGVEVNTTGAEPSAAHTKLWEITTDGSNNVTGSTDRRASRIRYDAPLEADTVRAHSTGTNLFGHRGLLTGSAPRWDFHDTASGRRVRIVVDESGGDLRVRIAEVNPGTGAIIEEFVDLADHPFHVSEENFVWHGDSGTMYMAERTSNKGVANGYASLNASIQVPSSQLPEATEGARGAVRLGDSAPPSLGASGVKGSSTRAARADHVHSHGDRSSDSGVTHHGFPQISGTIADSQHGNRGGGSLHSTATTSTHGFMSSGDKTALDNRLPSTGEKSALAGNSGTPSNTNRYITQDGLTFTNTSGTITNAQHGDRGGGSLHSTATTSTHGFMSSGDKTAFNNRLPTTAEKAALEGSHGAPGASNKYVTEQGLEEGLDFENIEGTITDSQHGSRGGGSLHATATTSSHGFLSSSDKTKLNDATSAATASKLMQRDGSGRAKVSAPSASDDIATKGYVDTKTSPAGSDGQIQFNDNGDFGGDSAFRWDRFARALSIIGTPGFSNPLYTRSGGDGTHTIRHERTELNFFSSQSIRTDYAFMGNAEPYTGAYLQAMKEMDGFGTFLFFGTTDSESDAETRMIIDPDGRVGIDNDGEGLNESAKLEVGGNDGGILFPRLTTAQRNNLTGVGGLVVYDKDENALFVFKEDT
jgi:hypothetical protein